MFNSSLHSNVRLIDNRNQQNYVYTKIDKSNRNGNRSLQRNMAFNQPLINKNGYNHLNQSVEGDIVMINSKFSPTNGDKYIYLNGEVKRTSSSIKINPEANDVVMPLENQSSNVKMKAGRMCSTLNHFNKKSPFIKNKSKQKQEEKADVYPGDNDYTSQDKMVLNRKKKLKKVK